MIKTIHQTSNDYSRPSSWISVNILQNNRQNRKATCSLYGTSFVAENVATTAANQEHHQYSVEKIKLRRYHGELFKVQSDLKL